MSNDNFVTNNTAKCFYTVEFLQEDILMFEPIGKLKLWLQL